MPLMTAAAVLFSVLVAQGEPRDSSWSAPPNTVQETDAPPVAEREPAEPANALAMGDTHLREVALALGAWAARPYGIGVLGGVLHVSVASEMRGGPAAGTFFDVACDLSGGRTVPGLRVGEGVVSFTAWSTPSRAMRGGAGLDLSVVGYRRATTGEWKVGTSAGGHLAFHADMLRARNRAGFVEVRAGIRALSRGAELSAVALVGVVFRHGSILGRRGERAIPAAPDDASQGAGRPVDSP